MRKIFEQRIKEQVVCVYENSNNDVFIGNTKKRKQFIY